MRHFRSLILAALLTCGCATPPNSVPFNGELLYRDDFYHGLDQWVAELENGGTVQARGGQLEIDVPAGCTLWFKHRLNSPVTIEYDAMEIAEGGANDRVSDLNCFWMATDPRSPGDIFARRRSGKFEDYNQLKAYYVGVGGNSNTTTRFRRYIGDPGNRPLLPEHDLRDRNDLLTSNVWEKIQLVANSSTILFLRNGRTVFNLLDPQPYATGYFGLRTVRNHMLIKNFRVRRGQR